jgi:hypothetical protein
MLTEVLASSASGLTHFVPMDVAVLGNMLPYE